VGLKEVFAGAIVLGVGGVLYAIQIPWIKPDGIPTLTTIRPLEPLAIILYMVGGIIMVLGITKNIMARFFLSTLIILGVLYLFKFPLPLLVLP